MVGDRKIFPTQYEYDGLDRRDSKCTSAEESDCGGGRRSDLAYVGLTQFLSAETPLGGAGEPASTEKARDFDYDADFDSLGVASKAEGETAAAYRAYSKDANGSVEGLEQGNGEIKKDDLATAESKSDRYDYTRTARWRVRSIRRLAPTATRRRASAPTPRATRCALRASTTTRASRATTPRRGSTYYVGQGTGSVLTTTLAVAVRSQTGRFTE